MQRRFPIDDVLLPSGDIRDPVAKLCEKIAEILMFLGRQISEGEGPKLLTEFINPGHHRTYRLAKFGDDRPSDLED